jgi:hypothetical protein
MNEVAQKTSEMLRVAILRGLCAAYRVPPGDARWKKPREFATSGLFKRLCTHERCDALLDVLDRVYTGPDAAEWWS